MSSTRIPHPTRLLLFGRAAGRCEYRGCNTELTLDDVTRRPVNLSAFAHIVADRPDGPRGHPRLSRQLATDIENLMLLCLDHHRMIDDQAHLRTHPVALLRGMKAEHEQRIRRLATIDGQHRTHLVLMEANIGPRKALVSVDQALEAVLPFYPVDDGIRIDLARLHIEDGKPIAWSIGAQEIDAAVDRQVRPAVQRGTAKHVSVFALAPIPLLMYLGRAIGDIAPGIAYQRNRHPGNWCWKKPTPDDQPIVVVRPKRPRGDNVALLLSFSGRVHGAEVTGIAPEARYEMAVPEPRTDSICTREQVAEFAALARGLLAEIRAVHGARVTVHLFPAVPNSIAVEFGKCLLPKADPRIEVYDRQPGGYVHALTLLEG